VSEDEEIANSVRAHGWHAISVSDHPPEFLYTCGLMTTFRHSEAIIFGLPRRSAYAVLAAMVDDIRRGRTFASPGRYDGVLTDFPIAVRLVHPSQAEMYLGYAMGHCRYMGNAGGLVAVQVFWPDKAGRFPFEVGCDQDVLNSQPRLDLPATLSELRAHRRLIGDLE
jgi:Domain of unknown function (DUF4262)